MATINYENKEALNVNPTIPNKNKVVDSDMNLIKQVGNQILTTMGVYTDNWTSSATYNVDEIAIYDNRIFKNLTGTNTATTPDEDTTNWEETTLASMSGGGGVTGDTLPIGAIVPYGSTTAPTNWLVCDGSAISRTTYAELFAVIGTSFGVGDGSTTFNLPNLKGKVAVGQDTNDTDFDTIGEIGGSKELQAHNHEIFGGYDSGTTTKDSITFSAQKSADGSYDYGYGGEKFIKNAGTGDSGNLQPYQVVCYIIKAKQSAGLVANVSNTYSTSETDTYSCNYINGIIESGASANGTYIKFFDGTLICRGSLGPITTNAGTGADLTVTLPYNFKDRWFDLTASIVDGQAYWGQIQFSFITLSGSQFKFVVWNNSGGINASQYFSYIAIGRWK